jgi:hypothetical protein
MYSRKKARKRQLGIKNGWPALSVGSGRMIYAKEDAMITCGRSNGDIRFRLSCIHDNTVSIFRNW